MKVRDHSELFQQQDYQEQFERKKEFENCWPPEKVEEVAEWTKTEEYKELNFARQNIKINPANPSPSPAMIRGQRPFSVVAQRQKPYKATVKNRVTARSPVMKRP